MSHYKEKFTGVAPALVTPMHADGSIDYESLKTLIKDVSEGGVDYLVVQGTTGESATTTAEEKQEILKTVQEANYKNLPIVYGLGGNNTNAVLKQIENTDFTGIDAILSVCPYYNKPSSRGIIAHYTAIADKSPVPVILYNIPGRTGINIQPKTVLALSKHPNIIGIKEASCIIEQCIEIVKGKEDDFLLISGDDVQAIPIISIGGVGVMSVVANAFPKQFSKLIHDALKGDFAATHKDLGAFLAIDPLLYEEGNPVGVKKICSILNKMNPTTRLPLMEASEELGEKLKAVIASEKIFQS